MTEGTQWAQREGPPRIDLLPRQLVEQRLLRRQRTGVGAAFLLLLALLGLWYVIENGRLAHAQDRADQERAVATDLRARRAQLQPLADLEAQIAAADREALEERREAIARGELKGRALTDLAEEARIEQEAAASAVETPEGE